MLTTQRIAKAHQIRKAFAFFANSCLAPFAIQTKRLLMTLLDRYNLEYPKPFIITDIHNPELLQAISNVRSLDSSRANLIHAKKRFFEICRYSVGGRTCGPAISQRY